MNRDTLVAQKLLVTFLLLMVGIEICAQELSEDMDQPSVNVYAEIWADNWFALYMDGEKIFEDSEPITQERSFNVEEVEFKALPGAQFAAVLKDYKEDDSGLEYIGSRRQQVGDGGFIAQFYDAETRELIGVSSAEWLCTAIHQAPLDLSCQRSADPLRECSANILPEPQGWMTRDFDDSQWRPAIVHSSQAVRPHGEYPQYNWDASADLIWSDDLEIDNTVLCRFTLD